MDEYPGNHHEAPDRREAKPPLPPPKLYFLDQLMERFEEDATAAYEARQSGQPRGPVSGLPALDTELGGHLPSGVHILHGAPGTGKTALALQIAADCGFPALLCSVEMSALELLRRLTARASGCYLGRLKSGELTPDQAMQYVRMAVEAYPRLALCDATQAAATPVYLKETAEVVRGDAAGLLVVVDSVHSWVESQSGSDTEYDALGAGMAQLRKLAGVLECPILAVAERNRATMSKGGLHAGAGSRKLEYGGESVLDLSRDPDARPDAFGKIPVELTLAKNRNGAPGRKVSLSFHGACQRFEEV